MNFTLDDFMKQFVQVRPVRLPRAIKRVLKLSQLGDIAVDHDLVERQIVAMQAIYHSINNAERIHPELLNASRRRRIADGAGVKSSEFSQFARQFEITRQLMLDYFAPSAAPTIGN